MRLKELKESMLVPDREILLNRLFTINNTEVLLISITSEQQSHKLWTLRKLPEQLFEEKAVHKSEETLTIRDRFQEKIFFNGQGDYISKMIIQGQTLTFNLAQSDYCTEQDHGTYMKLQHFIEKGLQLGSFADAELNRLFLTCYEQDPSEPCPNFDLNKEMDITLKFNSTFCSVPIDTEPIVLEFGNTQKEIKRVFYDPFNQKNRFFYIHALTRDDIWKQVEENFAKPTPESSTEEEWQEFKQQYLEGLESACSKGEDLAVIEYEAEDNIQLNFLAKNYLDAQPRAWTGGLGFSVFYKTERGLGRNGLKCRVDTVGMVDKTFSGSFVVELLSYSLELPELTIKL
ncbi:MULTISPECIES: hypothetical protein [Saccharibacillus]|uniref:hypothetical protein n=1 Tax=Saccharibacillus TaxID=456492 RepID=UPI00123C00D0|nr:hypothetical protein [Saccharibacillus sp. WB 17]MWJ30559.1 hypothetical protein [Saccharibacillus sp. WB 17]